MSSLKKKDIGEDKLTKIRASMNIATKIRGQTMRDGGFRPGYARIPRHQRTSRPAKGASGPTMLPPLKNLKFSGRGIEQVDGVLAGKQNHVQ